MIALFALAFTTGCASGTSTVATQATAAPQMASKQKPAVKSATANPTAPSGQAVSPLSVAGSWPGKWACCAVSGRVPLWLNQDGSRVWGTYDSPDVRPPYYNVKVEGTLEGNHLVLKIPQFAFGFIDVAVSEDGKTMEGRISGSTNRIVDVKFWRERLK